MGERRVVHFIDCLAAAAGGPSRTVPSLCRALSNLSEYWNVSIVVARREPDQASPPGNGTAIEPPVYVTDSWNAVLTDPAARPHLLHDHGQWLPINHASAVAARRNRLPRIVSPRGMLSPWARRHRRWKKYLAWRIYARRDLRQANLLHATSVLEADELRALGVKQPIAVIPNGVDPAPPLPSNHAPPERPYVLFMSRLHRKKGVAELLDVWRELNPSNWDLVLAGPDEERLLAGAPLPRNARYVGSVDGRIKQQLLADARVFVLPSYSENFGVVVAESLMAGVPVITTHGTPWSSLTDEGCGWWIPMAKERLRDALSQAMSMPAEELQAMGSLGRQFAIREFSWDQIGRQMSEVYQWVLGGGDPPACVCTK